MNIVSVVRSWHVSHRAIAVRAIVPSLFLGLGFQGAMERDDIGDGAQTQPLAASGSGCFGEVVAQSLAA